MTIVDGSGSADPSATAGNVLALESWVSLGVGTMGRKNYRNGDERQMDWHNCDSCNAIHVNGCLTHEHGCPDAWKDYKRECRECGTEFWPENEDELDCSHTCNIAYSGWACDCEECVPAAT